MKPNRHILVIDPTPFSGGSKVATENILQLLDSNQVRATILTADPKSWPSSKLRKVRLYQPSWLIKKQTGIGYFLRHIFIALTILVTRLRLGHIDVALGASGPGVDVSIYIAKLLLNYKVIQLVHGPVACSRTIGRCLLAADEIHYLNSTYESITAAIRKATDDPHAVKSLTMQEMQNGIPEDKWPTLCQRKNPTIFWAASILKWKGLDTLVNALKLINKSKRPTTQICYIRPKDTLLDVSKAPVSLSSVHWYENPAHIDAIRATGNIFVSTSDKEPFGMSILEAMAAGHCVVIPKDGAYWDTVLEDNTNCIKYMSGNAEDLAQKLQDLAKNMNRVTELGMAAAEVSHLYRAKERYDLINQSLAGVNRPQSRKKQTRLQMGSIQ